MGHQDERKDGVHGILLLKCGSMTPTMILQGETAELVAVVQPDSFPPDQQPSSSKRGEMLRELGEGISLRAFKSEEFPEASSKHRELCKQLEGSLCVHIRVSVILGSITFEHPLLPRDMMETPPPPLQLASRRRGAISGPAASEVSGHASGPSSSAALAHSAVYDGDDVAQVFLMDLLLRNKDLAAAKKSAVAKAQPQEERWSKKDQWDILWGLEVSAATMGYRLTYFGSVSRGMQLMACSDAGKGCTVMITSWLLTIPIALPPCCRNHASHTPHHHLCRPGGPTSWCRRMALCGGTGSPSTPGSASLTLCASECKAWTRALSRVQNTGQGSGQLPVFHW